MPRLPCFFFFFFFRCRHFRFFEARHDDNIFRLLIIFTPLFRSLLLILRHCCYCHGLPLFDVLILLRRRLLRHCRFAHAMLMRGAARLFFS